MRALAGRDVQPFSCEHVIAFVDIKCPCPNPVLHSSENKLALEEALHKRQKFSRTEVDHPKGF